LKVRTIAIDALHLSSAALISLPLQPIDSCALFQWIVTIITDDGIAVNTLWPRTGIATAAIEVLLPLVLASPSLTFQFIAGSEMMKTCRTPDIMSDAAHAILVRDARTFTGNFCVDDDILEEEGYVEWAMPSRVPFLPLMRATG
jgi:citronellol/citronellal dehydrogenase